jgi:carbon-monoxide dehydrogenase medium subunit
VRIGALTRHVTLLKSELLWTLFPVFRDAEEVIADPVVRNRGTIGGSLCQADPGEDLSAVCAALKAEVVIRSQDGERIVPMSEFHIGPYTTAVKQSEMLTEVRVKVRDGAGSAHEKLERRAGDFAIAASSVGVWISGGTIADAGIALVAVGPFTVDANRAAEQLVGKPPSEELFAQAGELASEEAMPAADGRGPVDYKRHLTGVLTRRALTRATARALHQES